MLVLIFTSSLSLYKMAEAMSSKAKRVLVSLLSSLHNYMPLSYETYFKIFDTKITSILLYGSELWGYENRVCIEQIHTYACKRYASAPLKTCNSAIMGDCGRFPLYIYSSKKCVKYWLRILHLPDHRYVRKCYNMLRLLDSNGKVNWVTRIRMLLSSNGFGYIWENQGVDNESIFLKYLFNVYKISICRPGMKLAEIVQSRCHILNTKLILKQRNTFQF